MRLFDKDSSSDDFLGEATLVLRKFMSHAYVVKQLHVLVVMPRASGDLLAAPKLTQTLPLVIPGSHHVHVCVGISSLRSHGLSKIDNDVVVS